jgi:hypothetical protein
MLVHPFDADELQRDVSHCGPIDGEKTASAQVGSPKPQA